MWTQQIYNREEDFLCDYLGTVEAVLPHLGGWQPNYSCNDRIREARRLAIARGTQAELAFEHAVIGYARGESGHGELSDITIQLRSSLRILWVGLRWECGRTIVETLIDEARQ